MQIRGIILQMGRGELPDMNLNPPRNAVGEMFQALAFLIAGFKQTSQFVEEIGITFITPEIETFIRDYIDTKRKKLPTKHEIRDTRNACNGVIHYNNIILESNNNDENKPSFTCILELIKRTLQLVLNDYQGWFFITSSLMNSYGNEKDNFIPRLRDYVPTGFRSTKK
jgi:hypothetical protein